MNSALPAHITAIRFAGDLRRLAGIRAKEAFSKARLPPLEAVQRERVRSLFLAEGVRITPALMPRLAARLEDLCAHTRLETPLEAYVLPDEGINAAMSRGTDRLFLLLHAGAIDRLPEDEFDHLLGHELGHALYGHVDVAEKQLIDDATLGPRHRLQLHAWTRAAEISADRVGLMCCGNPHAAVRLTFRMASGIRRTDVVVEPTAFADQWDQYTEEVLDQGSPHHGGLLTHPFPHLRMKALLLFHEAGLASGDPADPAWQARKREVDSTIEDWLALLDPLAREDEDRPDPLLAEFFLWGGLAIALADGPLTATEHAHIGGLCGRSRLARIMNGGSIDSASALAHFRETIARRREKLTAAEIFRILDGLAQVAYCDRSLDPEEVQVIERIGRELGVVANLVLERHDPRRRKAQ